MEITQEELMSIRAAVIHFMHRNVSINSPRYHEYEVILRKLTELQKSIKNDCNDE